MSTDIPSRRLRIVQTVALLAGLAATVTLCLLLQPHSASMARGALIGGLVMIALLAVAFLRGGTERATNIERSVSGHADERDAEVGRHALAIAGALALFWTAGAGLAVGIGAPAMPAVTIAMWGQLLTLVAGWFRASRQH